MSAYFKTVVAVDLDHPVLSIGDVFRAFRLNGFERALKSCFRYIWFDRTFLRQFHAEMARINAGYAPDDVRLMIADASAESTWQNIGKVDFVFSTDVFEHIPPRSLNAVMLHIFNHVDSDAIVITKPNVYTGICGGHDLKWYPQMIDVNSSEDAWSHLLDPGFVVNTYLNRLTRRDYVEIFKSNNFSVLEDSAINGRLGEKHLTDVNKCKLLQFDDYELFSNFVEFVLKKNAAQGA